MKKYLPFILALGLTAGCAHVKKNDLDVLPTPDFKALEEKVEEPAPKDLMEDPVTIALLDGIDYEAPDEKPLPKKARYLNYNVFRTSPDFDSVKDSRVKQAITGNYECPVRKIDDLVEADEHAAAFEGMLKGIAYNGDPGQLEFYGSNKGMDAVLLKQGGKMYLAVGREGLKLVDLYYFDSFENCEAEVLKGFFNKPENKDVLRLVGEVYQGL